MVRETARRVAIEAKGFLSEQEGEKLFELALEASRLAPCLEIGAYCGKSAIYLAEGCRKTGRHPLFSIDHHRGSAEQQPGQAYFDPDLYDEEEGIVNTFPEFEKNIRRADLVDWVMPVVAESERFGRSWGDQMLGLVFIDGGHGELDVLADFRQWSSRVCPGGFLCFHDIYPDPKAGGQAPYRMLSYARSLDYWEYRGLFESLGVLRRTTTAPAAGRTLGFTPTIGEGSQ